MTAAILSAVDVHKTYGTGDGKFEALTGVSIDIHEGESVAIIGKSGSGKSTLMHLLALLDTPNRGSILLDGRPATEFSRTQLNRARNETFGFVFQQFFLTPNQTVLENVMLPLKIAGVHRKERTARAMAALEQMGIADKAKNRATDLSGGQKQRVVIARALIGNPRIIFADEPTGNLDSHTGKTVEDILFTLNKEQGITLVIVTHDPELSARCDRQILISDGTVVSATTTTNPAEAAHA